MRLYSYEESVVRQERLARGADHCGSRGKVYALEDLVQAGRIVAPAPATRRSSSVANAVFIYAVDANYTIHVGFDGTRGEPDAVKHETLFHNADVCAAGELQVVDGMIVNVNDLSGSYRTAGKLETDRHFAEAVLTAIDRAHAPMQAGERARLREKAGRR